MEKTAATKMESFVSECHRTTAVRCTPAVTGTDARGACYRWSTSSQRYRIVPRSCRNRARGAVPPPKKALFPLFLPRHPWDSVAMTVLHRIASHRTASKTKNRRKECNWCVAGIVSCSESQSLFLFPNPNPNPGQDSRGQARCASKDPRSLPQTQPKHRCFAYTTGAFVPIRRIRPWRS